jgi:nucleoside-diphosphate-sugar epimerase
MLTISSSFVKTVLVTGARGFVGRPVVDAFRTAGWAVMGAVRHRSDQDESLRLRAGAAEREVGYREVATGELGPETDWRDALAGVDVVVHLAARVHQMRDQTADPLAEFRRVNVAGTRRLAEQAAEAGVKRFVFVSSIKVNGEGTASG